MDLSCKKISELREIAKSLGMKNYTGLKKDALIKVIEAQKPDENKKQDGLTINEGDNMVSGVLEVLPDNGFGFLRGENYLSTPKDVYVSPVQIRRFNLKTGDKITGIARAPKEEEKVPALIYVQYVNDDTPDKAIR